MGTNKFFVNHKIGLFRANLNGVIENIVTSTEYANMHNKIETAIANGSESQAETGIQMKAVGDWTRNILTM